MQNVSLVAVWNVQKEVEDFPPLLASFQFFTHIIMQPPIIGKLLPVTLMATKIFSIMSAREVVETDLPYFKNV